MKTEKKIEELLGIVNAYIKNGGLRKENAFWTVEETNKRIWSEGREKIEIKVFKIVHNGEIMGNIEEEYGTYRKALERMEELLETEIKMIKERDF